MKKLKNIGIGLLVVASAAFSSAHAFCGFYAGKADATLFNEASQVVVVRDGQRTVLSMLNDYKGPLNEFALIVPTPVTLQKGQVRVAEKWVFDRLDAYSSPRLAEYHDQDPCQSNFSWGMNMNLIPASLSPAQMSVQKGGVARDRALGVTVESRYTLEEYDIVNLSATKSDGLEIWLRENGYKIPKGARAALKPYINQGMKFFVAKVNLKEQLKTGYSTLRPLQFAFETEKFMLPMRLGMLNAPPDKAQDLIVYLLTKNGRVESSNYRTAKLPANVNLPDFVKPKFKEFYKAMFDNATKKEDFRVVFTEYFWDMAWCDPCADNPLSPDELRKAGVFWVGGDPEQNFSAMQNLTAPAPKSRSMPSGGGAQPVLLTRLHVRYTPRTFPEDLMFTQTGDRQNWQTRYVVQNPYGGSIAQCTDKVAKMDCEAMCSERVGAVRSLQEKNPPWLPPQYKDKDAASLTSSCVSACQISKAGGIEAATRYYQKELPARIAAEKQTLAQLTGWKMSDIDAMPGALRFGSSSIDTMPAAMAVAASSSIEQTWWRKLFVDTTNQTGSGR